MHRNRWTGQSQNRCPPRRQYGARAAIRPRPNACNMQAALVRNGACKAKAPIKRLQYECPSSKEDNRISAFSGRNWRARADRLCRIWRISFDWEYFLLRIFLEKAAFAERLDDVPSTTADEQVAAREFKPGLIRNRVIEVSFPSNEVN